VSAEMVKLLGINDTSRRLLKRRNSPLMENTDLELLIYRDKSSKKKS